MKGKAGGFLGARILSVGGSSGLGRGGGRFLLPAAPPHAAARALAIAANRLPLLPLPGDPMGTLKGLWDESFLVPRRSQDNLQAEISLIRAAAPGEA